MEDRVTKLYLVVGFICGCNMIKLAICFACEEMLSAISSNQAGRTPYKYTSEQKLVCSHLPDFSQDHRSALNRDRPGCLVHVMQAIYS